MEVTGLTSFPSGQQVVGSTPSSNGQISSGQNGVGTASGGGRSGEPPELPKKPTAEEDYAKAKTTFAKVGGSIAGVTALGLIAGFFKFGSRFPAKTLEVIGDSFGGIASVASPFAIVGNEIKNYFLLKSNGHASNKITDGIFKIFDDWREVFYRFCSVGFSVYIFKPFIEPEMWGKSIFHKIATVANIPNLIFTGYMWGIGNLKSILAWGLRKKEQVSAYKAAEALKGLDRNDLSNREKIQGLKELIETSNNKAEGHNRIYLGCKRAAQLGSIANPTMQGLRQWADSMAFITGETSASEFFERPLLGISRLVSLVVGPIETYAKGVDSLVRVAKESENLKPALPDFLNNAIGPYTKWFQNKVGNGDNWVKSVRHNAEILFHTLSPLSMFALFAPILDEKHLDEDVQESGGVRALLDKLIGRFGKTFSTVFTGIYLAFARLPQTIFGAAYFGKKLSAWATGRTLSKEELDNVGKNICDWKIIKNISNFAHNSIKKLVPDYYKKGLHGYLDYTQIKAKYAFEQVQESQKDTFNKVKELLNATKDPEVVAEAKSILDSHKTEIINSCLEYAINDARQGRYHLTDKEQQIVRSEVNKRIESWFDSIINPGKAPDREPLSFVFADFIAKNIFKPLDLETRIKSIGTENSEKFMTGAYDNWEVDTFEYELYPVLGECYMGPLRRTVNRLTSIFGMAA